MKRLLWIKRHFYLFVSGVGFAVGYILVEVFG
jgi:hypothetical protein